MAEILIVDDERVMREGMKANLQGEGFAVRTAKDGRDALEKIAEKRPDLVLLDVMMPKMNGFVCCEEIRKSDALLPVIFLTAKDSDGDQVRGLGLGADDYVAKSAPEAILHARIVRALSRARACDAAPQANTSTVTVDRITVDLKMFSVLDGEREIARLTKTEASILQLLTDSRDKTLSIDDLICGLRGGGFACEDAMLYSHVSHLRQKLGPAGKRIVCVRGAGYRLLA